MNKRLYIGAFLFGVVFGGVCGFADRVEGDTDVADLFDKLTGAKGNEYFRAREQLLKYGPRATPYLETKVKSEQLEIRVIARAALSWIQDAEINIERTEVLLAQACDAPAMHAGAASVVIGIAIVNRTGRKGRFGDVSKYFPAYRNAEGFLMEVAIKGLDPERSEFWNNIKREKRHLDLNSGIYQEVVQAIAAALLVGLEDKDVIETLQMLYEKGGRTMRQVAAVGLKRAGIEPEEPLEEFGRWRW